MKKLVFAVMVVVVFVCGSAYAANPAKGSAPSLKIGVIDLQKIIQSTPDAKRVNTELRKKFEPRQHKIMALQKKLQTGIDKLKRDEAILAASEKSSLQETIVSQRRDLERLQQDYQQDITMAQRRETDRFFAKVKTVVDKIAHKSNYDLVLQKNAIPYASNRVDITKKVIDALS